jgi:predicted amidohydrolase YtcJ
VFRADAWLRARLTALEPRARETPDLDAVSARLASYGVTGLTDATAHNGPEELALFRAAAAAGSLRQRCCVMGGDDLEHDEAGVGGASGSRGGADAATTATAQDEYRLRTGAGATAAAAMLGTTSAAQVAAGARKIVLDERDLPSPDALAQLIAHAHACGRNVAIHCVARVELVVACAALAQAGASPGDRIEHAAVAPPELASLMARLGLTVVTQPDFVRERGDSYLERVDAADTPWLYRCRGLLDAGVAVGGGTDAPFGCADPWVAMRSAVERLTLGGRVLGDGERIAPERALALFTSPPSAPGGPPRTVRAGAGADLCLLDRPWARAREELSSAMVRVTWCAGRIVWRAG